MIEVQRGKLAADLGDALIAARGETPVRRKAAELGLAFTTLRELEQGLANPTLQRVETVAAQYGLRLALVVVES